MHLKGEEHSEYRLFVNYYTRLVFNKVCHSDFENDDYVFW